MDMLKTVLGLRVPDPAHVRAFNAAKDRLEKRIVRYDLASQVAHGVRISGRKKQKCRAKP